MDCGVGIEEKLGGQGADINANEIKSEGQGKIVCGIGFLEVGLGERVSYEIACFRGRIGGEKHGGSVNLKYVVGFSSARRAAWIHRSEATGLRHRRRPGVHRCALGDQAGGVYSRQRDRRRGLYLATPAIQDCLLMDDVKTPHYNYVGDSILGNGAHLGASAILEPAPRPPRCGGADRRGADPTGLRKFGAILGDGAEVGCNAVLNPGTLLGRARWCCRPSPSAAICPPGASPGCASPSWRSRNGIKDLPGPRL